MLAKKVQAAVDLYAFAQRHMGETNMLNTVLKEVCDILRVLARCCTIIDMFLY